MGPASPCCSASRSEGQQPEQDRVERQESSAATADVGKRNRCCGFRRTSYHAGSTARRARTETEMVARNGEATPGEHQTIALAREEGAVNGAAKQPCPGWRPGRHSIRTNDFVNNPGSRPGCAELQLYCSRHRGEVHLACRLLDDFLTQPLWPPNCRPRHGLWRRHEPVRRDHTGRQRDACWLRDQ